MLEENFYDFLINKALEIKDYKWAENLLYNKILNYKQEQKEYKDKSDINNKYDKYKPCLKELYERYINDPNIRFIGILFDLVSSNEDIYKLIPKFHSIIPFENENVMNIYKEHTKECVSIIGFFISKEDIIEYKIF